MTNEEKAQELAIKYCKEIDPHGREVYNIGCGVACCEMADWKEKQTIDKACEWLNEWMQCGVHPQSVPSFIKQFKQAMEEQL